MKSVTCMSEQLSDFNRNASATRTLALQFFPKNENAVDSEGKNHRLRRRDDEDRERLSQREKKKHLPVCRGGYTHTYTPKHAPEQSIRFRKREYWLPILSPKFTTPRLEGAQKKRRNLTTSQGSSLRDRVAPPSGPPYNWPIWNFRRFSVRRKK